MKKKMFNNKYGLTKAVLEGRKTMTRMSVNEKMLARANDYVQKVHGTGHDLLDYLLEHSLFKVGEVVAVAQPYCEIMPALADSFYKPAGGFMEEKPGYRNKMFVRAGLMPHRIRITNVRVERLQDITDEDCFREGIQRITCCLYEYQGICYSFDGDREKMGTYKTAKEAFAALFDKISGKGTWESNPWVYVYEFELVR